MQTRHAALAGALVCGACQPQLDLPRAAQILCGSDADCPDGMQCRASLGRCVRPGADDQPPAIESTEVLTPTAGPLTPARVTFTVSEALSADPVVRLGSPSAPTFTRRSQSERSYEYELVPDATTEEAAWPVLADLLDSGGNAANAVALGTVVIDRTPPRIVAPSVSYRPAVDNPLPIVTAARDGTRFQLYFSTTEPTLAPPVVTAACGQTTAPGLTLIPEATNTSTFFGFWITLDPTQVAADGACPLSATFADAAANLGDDSALDAVALDVDRSQPDPDAGIDLAQLEQIRAPYGTFQTGGAQGQYLVTAGFDRDSDPGTQLLPSTAFTPEPNGAIAEVRAYSAASGGLLLGVIRPVAGGFRVPAMQADSAEMWLAIVDASGNESARRRVPSSVWAVTLGGKERGSTFTNPLGVERVGAFSGTLVQDPNTTLEPTQQELDALVSPDALTASVAGEGVWRRHLPTSTDNPPGTYRKRMAYDPVTGVSYLFGGYSACGPGITHGGLWRWDGLAWEELGATQQFRPLGRDGGQVAVDPRRGRFVMWSGAEQGTFEDTWEWDTRAGRWLDRTSATQPPGRRDAAFVYDSDRDVFLMFGGNGGSGWGEADFWEWDARRNVWREITASGPAPAARSGPGMIYDPVSRLAVLFGGSDYEVGGACSTNATLIDGHCFFGDTWGWDHGAQQWVALAATGQGPPERTKQTMVYDPIGDRALVMGGYRGNFSLNDLWQWSFASGWSLITPSGTPPSVRAEHTAAFDTRRNRLVVHAGERVMMCPAPAPTTWEWDAVANRWLDRTPAASSWPLGRMYHSMASLGAQGGVIMYGGYDGGSTVREVWRYDALLQRWSSLSSGPSGFAVGQDENGSPTIAFDTGRNRLVFLGQVYWGSASMALYEFNLATNVWSTPTQLGQVPYPRARGAFTYDATVGRAVLFGGQYYDATTACGDGSTKVNDTCTYRDLREWNGSSWTLRSYAGGPTSRAGHLMAHDARQGTLVAAGGQGSDSFGVTDHWMWNGTAGSFTAIAGTSWPSPEPGFRHTMSYDAGRDKTVVYGGTRTSGYVLEWDALTDTWTERVTTLVRPTPVQFPAAAYDHATESIVTFGGDDNPDGLFVWNGGARSRPALIFYVPLSASGAAAPIERIEARVRGDGLGYAGAVGTSGLLLRYWSAGEWLESGGPSGVAGEYQMSLDTPEQIRLSLTGERDELVIAVLPAGDNAQSVEMARVDIDAFELRVAYRYP